MPSVYPVKATRKTIDDVFEKHNRLIDLLGKDLSVVVTGGGIGDVKSPIVPGVINDTVVLYDGISGKRIKASAIYANWFDQSVATTASPTFVAATIGGVLHPINTSGFLTSAAISDTAYGTGWDSDTTHAPSKNAIYDKLETISSGSADVESVIDRIIYGGEGELGAQLDAILNGGAIPPLSHPTALVEDVLTLTNTVAYTPTTDYHPATKKYVDDMGGHDPVTVNATANGLSVDASQVLTLGLASTSATGALSDTDWGTFNGKADHGIVSGGTTGQALVKNSNMDYDVEWATVGGSASISDEAYGATWDAVTDVAPSKNAVYDVINGLPGGHSAVTINATANGLSVDGSQVLTLGLASTSTTGALSDTDWDTFNNKQNANETIPNDGWSTLQAVQYEEALVLRITASGDFTSSFSVGDKIKLTQDATTKIFITYQIDYSAPYTYFVLNGNGTTLSANAITNPYYSHSFSPTGLTEALRENQMLTDIKSVDGTGSGLDADTLDGNHASAFALASTTIPYDGWIIGTGTWEYVSATSFKINADYTTLIQKGDRVKWTQTTVKYYNVLSVSAYTGGYTTMTTTGGTDYTVANAAITSPYFSHVENPIGFPHWFNYTPTWTAVPTNPAIGNGTNIGRFRIFGKSCEFIISMTMGSSTTYGSGTWNHALPVQVATETGRIWIAPFFLGDSDWGLRFGLAYGLVSTATGIASICHGTGTPTNATAPQTWAVNDTLAAQGIYQF